jgi:hypothetical protein
MDEDTPSLAPSAEALVFAASHRPPRPWSSPTSSSVSIPTSPCWPTS